MNDVPNDLSQESADALVTSMKEAVRDATGLDISVERETWPTRDASLSVFVVILPPDATPEQRAEADYWLNEISSLFRYAEQPAGE